MIVGKNICNFTDRDICVVVNVVDQFLQSDDLITVDHKIDHGFFFVGITAPCFQACDTAAKHFAKLVANLSQAWS